MTNTTDNILFIEGCVESLNFSTIVEGDCKMKYIFRSLIVVGLCCTGLFLSGYSYADGRSDRYDNGGSNYNDVNRYQKDGSYNDHHCNKRDCKRCRKYNRNSRQNRQNKFSLRNNRPYFYFSFGGNDDRYRYGRWNRGNYRNDNYNQRHRNNGHKHHGKKRCKYC